MTSDKYLIELLKSSALPTVVLRPEGPLFSIIDINDAYLKLKGIGREKLIGKGFFETFYIDKDYDISGWMESLEKVLAQKTPDKIPVRSYSVPMPGGPGKERK
ncbi:MAG: PAS domain-containing protein, partial [Bacteroidota bacterium]